MKKKIIVFDLDGVLFDSAKEAEEYLLAKYPTMTREISLGLLTGNFHEEMAKFLLNNKPLDETPEQREARSLAYAKKKAETSLFPGIEELLERLNGEGYILAINTSSRDRNCLPLLERAGVENLFDFVGTVEVSKSKEEKLKIIKEKYGVREDEMLFITDTLGDLLEAERAHVPTVAVLWGAHDRSYFEREKHDNLVGLVNSVEELEKEIKK